MKWLATLALLCACSSAEAQFGETGMQASPGMRSAPSIWREAGSVFSFVASRDWNGSTLTPKTGTAFVTHGAVVTDPALPPFFTSGIHPNTALWLDRAATADELDFSGPFNCTVAFNQTTINGSTPMLDDGTVSLAEGWQLITSDTGATLSVITSGHVASVSTTTLQGTNSLALVSFGRDGTQWYLKTGTDTAATMPWSNTVGVVGNMVPGVNSKLAIGTNTEGVFPSPASSAAIYAMTCWATSYVPSVVNARHANAGGQTIAVLGDSITQNSIASVPYCTGLQRKLGRAYTVVNGGISGTKTADFLARWNANVHGHGFSTLIQQGGVNDANALVAAGTVESNLQTIYDGARADGLTLIPITIAPEAGNGSWSAGAQTILDAVDTWQLSYFATNSVTFVNSRTELAEPTAPTKMNYLYTGDGLHPGQPGHDLYATRLNEIINHQPQTDPPLKAPLFDEDANTVLHVVWPTDGGAPFDTKGTPLVLHGTVPVIAATASAPAGGGPFSDANYYSFTLHPGLPMTVLIAYQQVNISGADVLFSAQTTNASGFLINHAASPTQGLQVQGGGGTTRLLAAGMIGVPANRLQSTCFGLNATTLYVQGNGIATQSVAGGFLTTNTGVFNIGRYADSAGFADTGYIHEILVTTTDPATVTLPLLTSTALMRVR